MVRLLLRNTTLFLNRPAGAGLLIWTLSLLLLTMQPQPWTRPIRILLALLPALIPSLFGAYLRRSYDDIHSARLRLLFVGLAFLSWLALSLDIGPVFLSWVLVFLAALLLSMLIALRYTTILAAGMLLFATFYLSLRLHQGEQLLYLRYLVEQEHSTAETRLIVREEDNRLLLFEEQAKSPVLEAIRPQPMQRMMDPESDGFFGLSPAIVLSTDPRDMSALPVVAILLAPERFPARLWNMQIESSLAELHRQGRIGEAKIYVRESKCGSTTCSETLWIYEDRFHARQVQTGYALLSLPLAGPGGGARLFMIWFREPVVEAFPHHPVVLEFMRELHWESPGP